MQLLFKNVNYLKIVSKIKSGGILALVTLGTRSLRTGFKVSLKLGELQPVLKMHTHAQAPRPGGRLW